MFVAIAPPAAVLDELERVSAPLRAGRGDLRWTSREAWHVTLAFLGEVGEAAVSRLEPRLERAALRHRSFSLMFTGAGAFPGTARARVLWCGLGGDRGSLARLADAVEAGARRAGAVPPGQRRPFRPHLTLARCRTPADVAEVAAALSGFRGTPWTADRIYLIHSRPGGHPRFSTAGSWALGAAAAGPGNGG